MPNRPPKNPNGESLEVVGTRVHGREVVVRVRLDTPVGGPQSALLLTTRNCEDVAGLSPRQFRELVKAGVIRGTRLPKSKAVVAKAADVLAALDAAVDSALVQSIDDVDIDALLDDAGVERAK